MSDATVVIRADRFAKAGVVQKLIQMCQEEKFEKFALRARKTSGRSAVLREILRAVVEIPP